MRKQTKMAYLILAFVAIVSGCKKNEISKSGSDVSVKSSVNSAGDGKWDVLGYGLDVTRDLLDISSVSDVSIFDMKRIETDLLSKIDVNTTTEGTEKYYGGYSALDYLKDITTKKSLGISGNFGFGGTDAEQAAGGKNIFTGSLSKNSSDQNIKTFSSKYSYATYEVSQRVKRIRFNGDVSMESLMQYLTPEFVNNVATKSADDLVKRYGTHVMLDISIGGRLRFNYSGYIENASDSNKKTKSVKAGLGFSVLKLIGVNINSDMSKEEVTKITTETRNREYTGKFYGGTNSGRSVSIDKDGNTTENINIASWQQSINDRNAALLDVGKAVFLYDFIADPVKKEQVKAAVEKHIKDSQPKELGEVPVYAYRNSSNGDRYFTPDDKPFIGNDVNFRKEGISFYAFSKPTEGAVPVNAYRNSRNGDRYFTPDDKPFIGNDVNFRKEGIAFYAFAAPAEGTVPVFAYRNSKNGDRYFTPNDQPFIGNDVNFRKEGIAFHAYAN